MILYRFTYCTIIFLLFTLNHKSLIQVCSPFLNAGDGYCGVGLYACERSASELLYEHITELYVARNTPDMCVLK